MSFSWGMLPFFPPRRSPRALGLEIFAERAFIFALVWTQKVTSLETKFA